MLDELLSLGAQALKCSEVGSLSEHLIPSRWETPRGVGPTLKPFIQCSALIL